MIQKINQDIFHSDADIIAHGINCFCTQESGIAGFIRKYFPQVAQDDINFGLVGEYTKLGKILVTKVNNPNFKVKYIISMFQQFGYGTDRRQLDYEMFYNCLGEIKDYILATNPNSILAFPHGIGCGLAGGDFRIVEAMIESVFGDSPIKVLICKKS